MVENIFSKRPSANVFSTFVMGAALIGLMMLTGLPSHGATNPLLGGNVKNFGAKGDGVHDDTTAFQRAMQVAAKKGDGFYWPDSRMFPRFKRIRTLWVLDAALQEVVDNPEKVA